MRKPHDGRVSAGHTEYWLRRRTKSRTTDEESWLKY
jgi:hypothetical protein